MFSAKLEPEKAALAVILFFFAVLLLFPFQARVFVDVFGAGRSDVKVFLFPISVIILFFLYFFRFKKAEFSEKEFQQRAKKFFAALIILFTAQLTSFIFFLYKFGPGIIPYPWLVRAGAISSNQINHIDSFKPVLGWFVEFFPQLSRLFDAGYPFMSYIPFYVFIPFTIIFIYLFYCAWKLVPLLGSKLRYSAVLFLLLCLSLFTVLKNVVDGGLLNYETVAGLTVLSLLFFSSRENSKAIIVAGIISAAAVSLYFSALTPLQVAPFIINILVSAFFYLAVFFSFKTLDTKANYKNLVAGAFLFLLLASLFFWTFAKPGFGTVLTFSMATENHSMTEIQAGREFFVLAPSGAELSAQNFSVLKTAKINEFMLVEGVAKENILSGQVLEFYGMRPNLYYLNVDGVTCDRGTPFEMDFTLYDFGPDLNEISAGDTLVITRIGSSSDFTAFFAGCTPNADTLAADMLSKYDDSFMIAFKQ